MRILNITAQKPDSTGSGVYLAEMVRCEVEAGHNAAVVCGVAQGDPLPFSDDVAAYPVFFETDEVPFPVCGMSDEMPYRATRYRDMDAAMVEAFRSAFAKRIRRAMDEFQPDVVVCHHLYLLTALVRQLVEDIPVFAVCHSTDLRQMRSHGLERQAIIEGVCGLDGIFALHKAQREEIIELYGCAAEKVRVLGTGYNASVFSRGKAQRPQSGQCSLLYVGKIWEKKGVGCLLEALDQVHVPDGQLSLRLVGGHNDEEEFAGFQKRAESCAASVEFAGRLDIDDLVEAYRSADIFVLPSFFEGLPLVVVEALACGCRVVVSDLPGIKPWLMEHVPEAPVVFVRPPRMRTADDPYPEELPGFSERIARSIEQAAGMDPFAGDMHSLTWEGLTTRFVSMVSPFVEGGRQ